MRSRAQSFVRLCTIISETRCHFYNHWWDNLNFPCYCWILTLSVWFYCGYSRIIVSSKDASSKLTVCFYWLYENFGLISVSSMIVPVSLMIVQSHRWLFLTHGQVIFDALRCLRVSRKRGFFATTLSAFIAGFGVLTGSRARHIRVSVTLTLQV